MKLTGAAILVSRGMKVLQAAPAAYPYRSSGGKANGVQDGLITAAFATMVRHRHRASIARIGGFRRPDAPIISWFGGRFVAAVAEEWPLKGKIMKVIGIVCMILGGLGFLIGLANLSTQLRLGVRVRGHSSLIGNVT
jgi:hypothetical protein